MHYPHYDQNWHTSMCSDLFPLVAVVYVAAT